ncbi:hypothetical protein [Streptococcus sciuri]|uniref:Uncharacterized protein n=1 Tax=Streptococcus sciuri TaxID=2973939 RepID=A0ABT2F6G9_9STRE|nr:hypothetical protein [Streptococcus sciuri]MCS4487987.1 hypothetical protein [Streptococcus sciuri]
MEKEVIIYCYRMTHDYGINPCVFTSDYQGTPDLLTEGGCMKAIRLNLNKHWVHKIRRGEVEAYMMAVAGYSDDCGRKCDKEGRGFITPHRNRLIFVAKICDVISRGEYLASAVSKNRRDSYTYNWEIERYDLWDSKVLQEPMILSKDFRYFGQSALELSAEIVELFPSGNRAMLGGKRFPIWNAKNGFYRSTERPQETAELLEFIQNVFVSTEPIVDLPYYPIYPIYPKGE